MKCKKEYLYPAITSAAIGLFISLLLCVFLAGENLFWSFVPIWMLLGGAILNFALDFVKPITDKKGLKNAIILFIAIATGITLRFI